MSNKIRLYALCFLSFLILYPSLSFAYITGTENITFQNYTTIVQQGGKAIAVFNLTLVSGSYTFATTVSVANSQQLITDGITTIVTNGIGNPPLRGQLHIFASNSTKTGSYYVTLQGSSLNMTINEGQEQIMVNKYQSTTTSTTVTTSTSVPTTSAPASSTVLSSTSAPTTVAQGQGLGSVTNIIYYAIAIVALIIIVMILLRMRGGGTVPVPASPPPAAPPGM